MKNLLKEVKGNIYGMGVYCFKTEDKILYVGSGMLNDRLQAHLFNLKRGLYESTNKAILQKEYNNGELEFEVLKFSENNSTYLNGSKEEREAIQKALEVLEQFYVNLYKESLCNKMMSIKKFSSNKDNTTSWKRRLANKGSKNPNNKYDTELIANILWLKMKGLKPKKIMELLLEHDIKIKTTYISQLGVQKWIYLEAKKPEWFVEEVQ
nr:hypothetical protein [Clostridium neonatale]DAW05985.1 MAG TPA: GIY-YIG nuclease superfamily protein [Caudoviricetes sp.]